MRTLPTIVAACVAFAVSCTPVNQPTSNADLNLLRERQFLCRPPVRLPEEYYMVLGSFEGRGQNSIRLSHTFAVFCRCRGHEVIETKTISWMPRSLDVRVLRRPEPGVNLTYHQTIDLARKRGLLVKMDKPKKVNVDLYQRALNQLCELESGHVLYKCGDRSTRPRAVNCVHAVADVDKDRGYLTTGSAHGWPATSIVHQHLQRWVIEDSEDTTWLMCQIGNHKDK